MRNNRIFFMITYISLLHIGLIGCKTIKNSSAFSNKINEENVLEELVTNPDVVKSVWIKRYECEIIENWKRTNFYGDIKIEKGNRIVMAVKSGPGIETARIFISKDSVTVIDRVKKEIYSGRFQKMTGYLDLIRSYQKTEELVLGSNAQNSGETGMDLKNNEYERISIKYLDWYYFEKEKIPKRIEIDLQKKNEKIRVVIKYTRIEIDKEFNLKWETPEGYKVIRL